MQITEAELAEELFGEDTNVPKEVHLGYAHGDAFGMVFDDDIVRRIRADVDPLFVPVVKCEVWQWPTGFQKKFVHFGFGCAHTPEMPILDKDLYHSPGPSYGYQSTLPKASFAYWMQHQKDDGTLGPTIPFDERAYAHAVGCRDKMMKDAELAKKLQGSGDTEENTLPGVNDEIRQLAYRAVTGARHQRKQAKKKALDEAFDKVRYVLKQDKAIHKSFLDLTATDKAMMQALWEADGDRKNAKSISASPSPWPSIDPARAISHPPAREIVLALR